jgi:hypothetical protein
LNLWIVCPLPCSKEWTRFCLLAKSDGGRVLLHDLRADADPVSIETVEEELGKLKQLRSLQMPSHLFAGLAPALVEAYSPSRCGSGDS